LSLALLASVGVLVSTLLVGGMTWALSRSLGLGIDPDGADRAAHRSERAA